MLYRSQCGHCRATKPQVPIFLEAPRAYVNDEAPWAVGVTTAVDTRICASCGATIKAGEWITEMNDGTHQCSECYP
jgi:hypothetical protein